MIIASLRLPQIPLFLVVACIVIATSSPLVAAQQQTSSFASSSNISDWIKKINDDDSMVVLTPDSNDKSAYLEAKRMWIPSNEANVAAFLQPKTIPELQAFLQRQNNMMIGPQPKARPEVQDHSQQQNKRMILPRVQCGGHSFQSDSIQEEGGVTIDLQAMGRILEVNTTALTATLQGCVLAQDLYDAVGATGHAVIAGPHGNVGYSGYLLGGGQSSRSRLQGLAIDKVLHFRVITATGEELLVTPTGEHADLFWALQGAGGGNFGVVVEIKIEIFPHEGVETWGTVQIPYENNEEASRIFQSYVNFHSALDHRMALRLSDNSSTGGGNAFFAKFAFFGGDTQEATQVLKDFLAEHMKVDPTKVNITADEFASLYLRNRYEGDNANATMVGDFPHPYAIHSAAGSAYMSQISQETSQWIIEHFQNESHPCQSLQRHWQFSPVGGKIHEVPKMATAFWGGREAEVELEYYVGYLAIGPGAKDMDHHCQAFVNQVIDRLEQDAATLPGSFHGSYYNHVGDGFDKWAERFWGGNLDRLKAIKAKYDPDNFWQWRYSVPHTSTSQEDGTDGDGGDMNDIEEGDDSSGYNYYYSRWMLVLPSLLTTTVLILSCRI